MTPTAARLRLCFLLPRRALPSICSVRRRPHHTRPFTTYLALLHPASTPAPPSIEHHSISALEQSIEHGLIASKSTPSESEILIALQACQTYAAWQLGAGAQISPTAATPTSALLSLDDERKSPSSVAAAAAKIAPGDRTFAPLTDLAFKLVSHPPVFLTAPILSSFVSLQSLIGDPTPIPAVFALYAHKPYTVPGSSKPTAPNPRQAKYAIQTSTAAAALDAAIKAKDMTLCLDIIDTSYSAPAFTRSKTIQKLVPVGGIGCLLPFAAYGISNVLAQYQDEVDHALAVKYAFAGLLAYVCFTGTIGAVAVATANDQMVRVTWAPGTPLRQRWLREEERAALDRVAQAWGFESPSRHGSEEGEEWELLGEVAARKGMYLDNPALMEGME